MTTFADSVRTGKVPWQGIIAGFGIALLVTAVAIPNLNRSRMASDSASRFERQQLTEPVSNTDYGLAVKAKPAVMAQESVAPKAITVSLIGPDAAAGRKIIRTSSLEMVVQNPAEMEDRIAALAEGLGGYLVNAEGGGQNATTALLTICVPAARFEQARAEIRKFGLRVEGEKIDAQDVTRQYVDQDANLRNLHAVEAQYLAILKQANTVKDMLAVSEKLSETRGQIEQQQAEFNALSQQIETVAITISLRTEAEARVLGLNWRPLFQLKLALRDGLDGLANYVSTMAAIVFFLPTVALWLVTILVSGVAGWRAVRWVGRRFFGWSAHEAAVQG